MAATQPSTSVERGESPSAWTHVRGIVVLVRASMVPELVRRCKFPDAAGQRILQQKNQRAPMRITRLSKARSRRSDPAACAADPGGADATPAGSNRALPHRDYCFESVGPSSSLLPHPGL